MLKKLGLIAFIYVGALVCAFVLGSVAEAAPETHDDTETAVALFSQFKTFGDVAKWCHVYKLATDQELRAIETSLKKDGLSFKSDLEPGVFSPKRMNWGEVYTARIIVGDWKTIGGRILIDHKETPIDGLFEQARKTFNPKSASLRPFDLLIDNANAMPTAKMIDTAAAAWTWVMASAYRASSGFWAWDGNFSIGEVECSPDGKYMINKGWTSNDKSFRSKKVSDTPLDPKLVAALVAKEPKLFKKCSEQTAATATALLRAPGRTPAEKIKYMGSEFDFGMANALDASPRREARAAR